MTEFILDLGTLIVNISFFCLIILFLIIGIYLVVTGVGYYGKLSIQPIDDRYWYYWSIKYYFLVYILPGTLMIIAAVVGGIYFYLKSPFQLVEKQNYMNLKWLIHHYYELGMSLQDIADAQGVSMITIKKWVDKLDAASVDVGANTKD